MEPTIFNLSKAAVKIGISRPTLYKYLKRPEYKAVVFGGRPTLTLNQVKAIKAERAENGSKPKKK